MGSIGVGNGIHVAIGGSFPFCNTIVVITSEELVVIDPGCPIEELRSLLKNHNLELRDIDTIILTHIHPDHITHTTKLHRLSRCRIAANEMTASLFNDKEEMKKFLGFHKKHPIRPLWEDLVNRSMYGALEDGRVDEELRNGDKFAVGDLTLRVLYTPGHLPDHMCIEFLEPNLIFASDIDCTRFGPFYGHENSSIPEFRESIRMLKKRDYKGMISGHLQEPLIIDYRYALSEYEKHFDRREEAVLKSIRDGAETIDDLSVNPIVYPPLSDLVLLQFEKWMVEHHVSSLMEKGLVEAVNKKLIAISPESSN